MPGKAPQHSTVAVIGTGVIGRSWARVFARAGLEVRMWDADPAHLEAAWEWFKADIKRARRHHGLRKSIARSERESVTRCTSLAEALEGATYVQESGPERLDLKQALYRDLDALAAPRAILASSTSALDMTLIAEGLEGAERCVVAHPVNPPHIVPAVEVLGGERTDPRVVRRTMRFLERVGQAPVLLRRYVPGFLLNRMQAALVREAISLVAEGVASVEAVDAVVRDGLGLRWAMMGPFGVANTNADGGVREYFERYGHSFESLWADLKTDTVITPELLDRLGQAVDIMYRRVPPEVQRNWRDDMVERFRRLKAAYPLGAPAGGED
jgi:3-hydroxyacyl-CoA dehydrogenase